MGSLYSGTSVSGYNSNPPPDDGSTGSLNQLQWNRDIKGKIGDPLNTFAASASSALVSSFNKTLSGGSVVKTAVNYGASAADQGRNIVATASGITVTTPDATSVLSPFVWAINNQSSGNITVAGFSSQNIDGSNTARLGANRGIILWTDGSNWFSSGLVMGNLPTTNPPFGFDSPINLQLNATVASNILTVAVKANDGTDPTTSNPVLIPFRDSAIANGDPVWLAITSALSINTNAVGATLGTANSVAFRIWVVCFNKASSPLLALYQTVTGGATPTAIAPLNESVLQAATGISAAATSAGVFYCANGQTISAAPFRIIGYVEYANGLATAGTYASAPTTVQLFGPGIKKPGDYMQFTFAMTTSTQSTVSTTYVVATAMELAITPTSTPNIISVDARGFVANVNDGDQSFTRLSRGTGNNTNMFGSESVGCAGGANTGATFANYGWDLPQTTSSQTYALQFRAQAGTAEFGGSQMSMEAKEIQV